MLIRARTEGTARKEICERRKRQFFSCFSLHTQHGLLCGAELLIWSLRIWHGNERRWRWTNFFVSLTNGHADVNNFFDTNNYLISNFIFFINELVNIASHMWIISKQALFPLSIISEWLTLKRWASRGSSSTKKPRLALQKTVHKSSLDADNFRRSISVHFL